MFIQKSLHVNRSLEDTKGRLLAVPFHRRQWSGVDIVEADGAQTRLEFQAGLGLVVKTTLEELPSDEPNEILFHSCEGNVTFVGMIEFARIKDQLTEITLTLDYTVESPLHAFMNRVTGAVDRFLNEQLADVQAALNVPAPTLRTALPKPPRKLTPAVYRVASPALSI